MERTIRFFDQILSLAKHYQSTSRLGEANETYRRLLALKQVPADIAEEAQGRLAELDLQQGRLANARRHLSAALGYQPNHSHYHYLMGVAAEAEDERRALRHYARSIQLHPNQPDYLCDFGVLAVHMGYVERGLRSLRRAMNLAPDDMDVLERVTDGLRCAGHLDEAKRNLRVALFRTHGDARVRKLIDDLECHALRESQSSAEQAATPTPTADEPIVLQFRTDVSKSGKSSKPTYRLDGPSRPGKPYHRFRNDDHRPAS